jgi:hypothetical protein
MGTPTNGDPSVLLEGEDYDSKVSIKTEVSGRRGWSASGTPVRVKPIVRHLSFPRFPSVVVFAKHLAILIDGLPAFVPRLDMVGLHFV